MRKTFANQTKKPSPVKLREESRSARETEKIIQIGGRSVSLRIRLSAQARRLILRHDPRAGGFRLTLPRGVSVAHALRFVEGQAGWISAQLDRATIMTEFRPGAQIPIGGRPVILRHEATHRGPARLETRPETRPETRLEAQLEDGGEGGIPVLVVGGDAAFFARRVGDFLKAEARQALTHAVRRHAATLGVTVRGITVRDTRSRWGSCSSMGALNFSWRLIMAPPAVLDYVAAHEVAHLRHHDHSPAFWRVVAQLYPDWRSARDWLKAHGSELLTYG